MSLLKLRIIGKKISSCAVRSYSGKITNYGFRITSKHTPIALKVRNILEKWCSLSIKKKEGNLS